MWLEVTVLEVAGSFGKKEVVREYRALIRTCDIARILEDPSGALIVFKDNTVLTVKESLDLLKDELMSKKSTDTNWTSDLPIVSWTLSEPLPSNTTIAIYAKEP